MTRTWASFRRDESGNVFWDVVGLLLVILIPVGLFVLVYVYLRRTAPGGTVPQAASTPATTVEDADAPLKGAKTCARCGYAVKPFRGRMLGVNECPNCGSPLG